MSIPKCYGKFRSTECDLQSCDIIHLCEEYTMCLADRINLLSKVSMLECELDNLREGICELSTNTMERSRVWANMHGDMNGKKETK